MIFREANLADIKQIQVVRNAVKENTLSAYEAKVGYVKLTMKS